MDTKIHENKELGCICNECIHSLIGLETSGNNLHVPTTAAGLNIESKLQRWLSLRKNKIISTAIGTFLLITATGYAQLPTYKQLANVSPANPFEGLTNIGQYSNVSAADLDGDGDLDLLSGSDGGLVYAIENLQIDDQGANSGVVTFATPQVIPGISRKSSSTTSLNDIDGDGDLDLMVGAQDGVYIYYENLDIDGANDSIIDGASFITSSLIGGFDTGSYGACDFADLDGDGDLDFLGGNIQSEFRYFRNSGNATNPNFSINEVWPLPAETGFFLTPSFADLDADGDQDLVFGNESGEFLARINKGDFETFDFSESKPLNTVGLVNLTTLYSTPELCDFDGDGDFDLFSGGEDGNFYYYENVDQDLDNDGILDVQEVTYWENNQMVSYAFWGDEDGDGIPNYRDTSDDGDGDGSLTNYTDSNNDRIADVFDTDLDGRPNYVDLDSDNDGIPDVIEAQTTAGFMAPALEYGADNGVDIQYMTGLNPVDTDGDNVPDFLDLDTDNDGLSDAAETGMTFYAVYYDNGLDITLNYTSYDDPTAGRRPADYPENGIIAGELDYRNDDFTMSVPEAQTSAIRLSTNPVSAHFQIMGLSDTAHIAIYNTVGLLVQTVSNYDSGVIPVNLESGVYYVHISHNSAITILTLVVVQ